MRKFTFASISETFPQKVTYSITLELYSVYHFMAL